MSTTPRRLVGSVLVVVSAAMIAGCSDPTLEEACADYCATIVDAGCGQPTAEQCAAECDGVREGLDGKCIEEYTDAYDCAAGSDYECQDGRAVATSSSCLDEALTVLECTGFLTVEE